MEVALDDSLPTYSGGLGVLAGDHLRSAADLGLPLVGVSLLYRGGYFAQGITEAGTQTETPVEWFPAESLEEVEASAQVEICGRKVQVAAWRHWLKGASGRTIPVYFLDTELPGNDAAARRITDQLYSGDAEHRLCQEAVLGLGGMEVLRQAGHAPAHYHMNEGHSALLILRQLEEYPPHEVRAMNVFTTHTPVPAGHDLFDRDLVRSVLGDHRTAQLESLGCLETNTLNMTELGIAGSEFVNGVSRRHGDVTREMFPGVAVRTITNGVHVATWAAPSVRSLFDRHLPGWRWSSEQLRYSSSIPLDEVADVHSAEKRRLLDQIVDRTGRRLDPLALTIGTARRATPYKQLSLILSDPDRLASIGDSLGPIQIVFAGKAHPRDLEGKAMIERIVRSARRLSGPVEAVFLEGYDMRLASLLVAGSDVWLNTPLKPNEASGTSGMKAAINGVPSLSTLDGWWLEGWVEGVTGWAVGGLAGGNDAADLYQALERSVVRSYYHDPDELTRMRRNAMALNGSFFTSERMVGEYARFAYGLL